MAIRSLSRGCSLSPLGLSTQSRRSHSQPHLLNSMHPRGFLLTATCPLPIINSCCVFQSLPKFIITLSNSSYPLNLSYNFIFTMVSIQTRSSHQKNSSSPTDNSYLTSTNKHDAGVKITRIGLYSNLTMAIAKGIGGVVFNSQSMVADAWHSLTDMASDILTLATVSYSKKAPTTEFPAGYGKIESLGALGVSSMLFIGGCFMCYHSCEILYTHFFLNATTEALAHTHGHNHDFVNTPSLQAAWLALGTILVKEWLYHATMRIAKERKSSVLASNAIHHRIDSLTGVVTLLAVLGANFLREAPWLDPIGGFLISLLVIKGGWENTTSSLYELADKSISEEVKMSVRRNANIALGEINAGSLVELQDIEGYKAGQNYMINLQIAVPSKWTIQEIEKIENELRQTIGSKMGGIKRVQVRFVSKGNGPKSLHDEFIGGDSEQDPDEHKYHKDPVKPIENKLIIDESTKISVRQNDN